MLHDLTYIMVDLSVNKAAEIAGVTRQTISRKIKDGTLSKNTNDKIDLSELLRVYPFLNLPNENLEKEENLVRVQELEKELSKKEIEFLKKEIENLKEDKANLINLLEKQTNALPYLQAKAKQKWWHFWKD